MVPYHLNPPSDLSTDRYLITSIGLSINTNITYLIIGVFTRLSLTTPYLGMGINALIRITSDNIRKIFSDHDDPIWGGGGDKGLNNTKKGWTNKTLWELRGGITATITQRPIDITRTKTSVMIFTFRCLIDVHYNCEQEV